MEKCPFCDCDNYYFDKSEVIDGETEKLVLEELRGIYAPQEEELPWVEEKPVVEKPDIEAEPKIEVKSDKPEKEPEPECIGWRCWKCFTVYALDTRC